MQQIQEIWACQQEFKDKKDTPVSPPAGSCILGWDQHWWEITHYNIRANWDKRHTVKSCDEMGMSKLVQGIIEHHSGEVNLNEVLMDD